MTTAEARVVEPTDRTSAIAGSVRRRSSWLALLVGAWLVAGLVIVIRALDLGLTNDVGISPYHIPAYICLTTLTMSTLLLVSRSIHDGRGWRRAFAPGYGSLGAGLIAVVVGLVLDVGWREGVGITAAHFENGIAPSRVLVYVGVLLVTVAPLRAALGSTDAGTGRWPAVIAAGLTFGLVGAGGLHPAENAWLEQVPFDPNGEIWVMDADGNDQTRLIHTGAGIQAWNAVWSPDGHQFAFTRLIQGTHPPIDRPPEDADVYLAAADGSDVRPVVTRPGWQWLPHWSPDGLWLVYTDEPEGGPWAASGPSGPLGAGGLLGLGFLAGQSIPARQAADIWRVRADGSSAPERLTDAPGDDRAASYSPDGSKLVFDSTRDGNTEVYVMDADGSDPRRLTNDPPGTDGVLEDWGATFSPDGSRIAFNSGRTGDYEIWVMDVDGGGPTRVTTDPSANAIEPSWSADGSRIAYRRWIEGELQGNEIWSVATDGTDSRNLSRARQDEDLPSGGGAWAATGRILYTRFQTLPHDADRFVREGLGAAAMLLIAVLLSLSAVVVRLGPPFGAYALILGSSTALVAAQSDDWRFVPAAVVGGLIVDLLVRYTPEHRKARVAGAGAAGAFVMSAGFTVAMTTELGWSWTLLLGVALASAAIGWALGGLLSLPHVEPDGGSAG